MRIGKYYFTIYRLPPISLFNIEIQHKYNYLWNLIVNLFGLAFTIEICRTDWNKYYKNLCINYTNKCKHNIECNPCMQCYKEKEKAYEIYKIEQSN